MLVTVGPDGLLATPDVADYPSHVVLAEHLRARHAAGDVALERALPRFRRELSKHDLVALIRAIQVRIGGIAEP
jgi:hypothetical protein